MKHKVIFFFALFILFAFLNSSVAVWASTDDLLSLENKYIKVFINNSAEEAGRFAVDVTGGDPGRSDDDNKPLIYGHPRPWTSFTTLRIDGINYVFGKSTNKRSGVGLPGGEITQAPRIADNRLTMKCKYGAVEVEQLLDIARSPSTGALDTARIKYLIINTGTNPVEFGIRTLLDTMVGNNDGAPFRIGAKALTTDYSCNSNECPDFWQAFDSLNKPAVIAQGTLKGGDVTTPDRLIFTNWGKAADNPWDITLQSGADFTRFGEDELDSAVAMYWNPRSLKPGEQFSITIYYGLGGITFSPGKTYLGISAPAEVQYSINGSRSYTIMMYLEHRGEAKAENVKINLSLPVGLECTAGKTTITLPELIPGVTKQFSWEIKPNGSYQGDTNFQIKVSGAHLESNMVTRKIKIVGPPQLTAAIDLPVLKVVANNWDPYPVGVAVQIKNIGESAAYDLKATFISDAGVMLAVGERNEKYLLNLESKDKTDVSWRIIPTGDFKTGSFKVMITGTGIKPFTVNGELDIPLLSSKISFSGPDKLVLGQVINLNLYAYNLQDASKFSTNVKFDPKQLRLVYVSRGTFLVEDEGLAQWNSGTIDNQNGLVSNIGGIRSKPFNGNEITLIRLNFIVIGTGAGQVALDNLKLLNSKENELACDFAPIKYQIEEEKK
jgi:hypothetical protein